MRGGGGGLETSEWPSMAWMEKRFDCVECGIRQSSGDGGRDALSLSGVLESAESCLLVALACFDCEDPMTGGGEVSFRIAWKTT
jgi:hypothetical protein